IYLIDNFPPETGHTLLNNRVLKTLDKLAQDGPDVFYSGEIADSIEAVMFKYGGGLRKSDLMAYQPEELKPVRGTYRGYEIFSATPPQSGITVIEILNILECQDLSEMGDYTTSPSTFHFMAEAMKRGYADRSQYLSDPNFNTVPVNILISKKYAMSRFRTINMDMAVPSKPKETSPGDLTPYLHHEDRDGSTTHISVIDASGNAVSLTQTLNRFWGSGISVCGILLNNGMTGFSAGGQINQISSNRQPRTTIAPSMLFKNGELIMVIGSPGAGRIISTIVEVICNVIDFGKGADEANIAPRFCSRKSSNTLPVEARFSPDFLETIKSMGHPIEVLGEMDLYFGGVQLILVDQQKGVLTGSSDPRRSGSVSGY
ncbi:MAG: gamma-glutamyltransferase, partial [bacterium]